LGGDQAVRTFAMTILQHIRPVDVLAHVDANRFVVFLPQANVEQSGTVVARIKSKIGEADITTPNGDALPPMPYSIGVCEGRADDTLDALIARADAVARRADTP
jgi:diguanylate cyclase (GGDEF)-like protein